MKIDQITLIVPPFEREIGVVPICSSIVGTRIFPSLGLGYIAAVLENVGHKIRYIDMYAEDLKIKDLLSRLRKSPPSIVGITSDVVTYYTARKIAFAIKRKFPDSILITGGPHTTLYPKELLINSSFDFCVRGEGEHTIIELIDALMKNQPLKDIKGLSYKENGNIFVNENRPLIKDLDKIPFPARHLMPMDKYCSPIAKKGKFTTIMGSRGCPFRCSYCLEQGPLRLRSPKNIVDEIEFVMQNYDISEFYFHDSTFTANVKHAVRFCQEIIKRKLNIIWECKTRVDCVSRNLLGLMKYAGCERIHYGIETGNPRIMKVLNKKLTLKQALNAINWTKEANIEVLTYFMIGSPHENLNTIADTLRFAKKLDPDFALFSVTSAGPGMAIYEAALKEGVFKKDYWMDFILGNIPDLPRLSFETDEYTREDLVKIAKKMYFQFYFRPRLILKRLRKIKSKQELYNHVYGLLNLIKSFFESS
ncbi:MAG: cobalamin B12-binding domain-containing protein [Candidatus Helarchaeota archaeon]|nr:cobalamin B12-binding domain-containing protein [Candidatus Helarchaeota archaeon]